MTAHRAHFARRFTFLRLLRASLVLAALVDLALAVLSVAAPAAVARRLALPLPAEPLVFWLVALLLSMLAVLWLFAAFDPRRYSAIIAVGIAGRATAAAGLALAALGRPQAAGLWALAAADLALALSHALFWRPVYA